MLKSRLWLLAPAALLLPLLLAASSVPAAAADPTMREVYATARAGQVDKAIEMMGVVLKDHPQSAKAHYVQAELLAKQKRLSEARAELATAERLDPALKGIQPQSVSALKGQLGGAVKAVEARGPSRSFSWFWPVAIGIGVFALLAFFRRRNRAEVFQPPVGGAYNGGPNGYGQQTYPQQGGFGGGGFGGGGFGGGGLMGNLAAGAAAGVGFAAGERIIDGMFGEHEEKREQPSNWSGGDSNADMGGDNFGISDDSWDAGDSGGGDSGDW
jgi:hypothetical protein